MRYDYICSHKHITTREFPMGDNPETVDCPGCQAQGSPQPAIRRYAPVDFRFRVYNHRARSDPRQNSLGAEAFR